MARNTEVVEILGGKQTIVSEEKIRISRLLVDQRSGTCYNTFRAEGLSPDSDRHILPEPLR